MRTTLEAVADLIRFYEGLSPGSLGEISRLYAPGASFKDPFNEVRGVEAIEGEIARRRSATARRKRSSTRVSRRVSRSPA